MVAIGGGLLGWSVDAAILAVGVFSLVYTSLGGIVADIWSDVLQRGVLWVGVGACGVDLLAREGGTTGLAVNAGLALLAPGVSWLWWNPAGFGAAVAGALVVGRTRPDLGVSWPTPRETLLPVAAFAAMMAVILGLTGTAGAGGRTP